MKLCFTLDFPDNGLDLCMYLTETELNPPRNVAKFKSAQQFKSKQTNEKQYTSAASQNAICKHMLPETKRSLLPHQPLSELHKTANCNLKALQA